MRNTHAYIPFLLWLQERCDTANDTLIHEVSAEFPKEQINKLFDQEFDKAYRRVIGDSMHLRDTDGGMVVSLGKPTQHLTTFVMFQDYDWCGYISKALANAGVPPHDRDSAASQIVVQLLVKPGRLFTGWDGHAPLEARWKLSVRNAVINAGVKAQKARRRKSLSFSEPGVEAAERPQYSDEVVKRFVGHVGLRLGDKAKRLLQHLLDGGEVKDLVGVDGATSYQLKEMKKAIKRELLSFGANDPDFLNKVKTALTQDEETLNRRFGGNRRQLSGS
jgi:hypothetical protein